MAKKQTRRSISVSRTTYERLKAFCEANNISMSQLVETRVNDFLGGDAPPTRPTPTPIPSAPRPVSITPTSGTGGSAPRQSSSSHDVRPAPVMAPPTPMTSAAARFAVEPPPPIIKLTRSPQEESAPKPAEKRPEQIFTF
jgi:hypothetical protein